MEQILDKDLQEIEETFENLAAQLISDFEIKISEDNQ